MNKTLLLAASILACSAAYAQAQIANSCTTDPVTGNTFCDPTSFHVGAPGATGSDPVLLNNSTTFSITTVGNHDISQPIRVYFIEPLGAALPTITGATGFGVIGGTAQNFTFGATGTVTSTAFDQTNGLFDGPTVTISSGQDFGKAMNLKGADASVSFANISAEYTKLGLTVPTTFQLEDAVFPVAFNSDKDFITLDGTFGIGTVIAPLAVNVSVGSNGKLDITTFDTSWTNAGFINKTGLPPIPEPRTWALMLIGLAALGVGHAWFASQRNARAHA